MNKIGQILTDASDFISFYEDKKESTDSETRKRIQTKVIQVCAEVHYTKELINLMPSKQSLTILQKVVN